MLPFSTIHVHYHMYILVRNYDQFKVLRFYKKGWGLFLKLRKKICFSYLSAYFLECGDASIAELNLVVVSVFVVFQNDEIDPALIYFTQFEEFHLK